jgi:hypothetical protein
LAVAALVGLLLWLDARKRRVQTARFQAFADANELAFFPDEHDTHRTFSGFDPFGMGHAHRSDWVLRGEHGGRPFTSFQYTFKTQSGKQQKMHTYRICEMRAPMCVPQGDRLLITPEHFGHKIFEAFGGEDIDFESDEFSRQFWVRCKDRRFAYDVIHPQMMEYLLGPGRGTWQWLDDRLLRYEEGSLDPPHVFPMLTHLGAFVDQLPRHRLHS